MIWSTQRTQDQACHRGEGILLVLEVNAVNVLQGHDGLL